MKRLNKYTRLDAIILFEAGDENEKIEFYRYAVFNIFVLSRSIRTIRSRTKESADEISESNACSPMMRVSRVLQSENRKLRFPPMKFVLALSCFTELYLLRKSFSPVCPDCHKKHKSAREPVISEGQVLHERNQSGDRKRKESRFHCSL